MTILENNDKYQKKALGISILVYIGFLLILFFMKISYIPPVEDYALGVDLNYGVDLVGYGDLQTLNKANNSTNPEEMAPSDKADTKPEIKPTPKPKEVSKEVKPTKTVEKKVEATPKKVITSSTDKTPVVKNSTSTSTSKNTTPAEPVKANPTPAPPQPQRTVDQGSLFGKKGASSNSNGTVGTKTGIGGNNNGDGKPGDVGDQGSPQGTLDGKSLYGKPGSGGGTSGGASVNISGWKKRSISLPKDNSNEVGKIVFDVAVDNFGEVKTITVAETTVSPSVVNFYKSYLQKKLSSFLVADGNPPPISKGRITIIIKAGN